MNILSAVKENFFRASLVFTILSCFIAFYFYLCGSSEIMFFLKAQESGFKPEIGVFFSILIVILGILVVFASSTKVSKTLSIIWGMVHLVMCSLLYWGWESGYPYLGWSHLLLPFVLSASYLSRAFIKCERNSNEKLSEWVWSSGTFFLSCQITICIQAILVTIHLSFNPSEILTVIARLNSYLVFPILLISLLFTTLVWVLIKSR